MANARTEEMTFIVAQLKRGGGLPRSEVLNRYLELVLLELQRINGEAPTEEKAPPPMRLPPLICDGFSNLRLQDQAVLLLDGAIMGWTPLSPVFASDERRLEIVQALIAWSQMVQLKARNEQNPHMFFIQKNGALTCGNCDSVWDGLGAMPAGPCVARRDD